MKDLIVRFFLKKSNVDLKIKIYLQNQEALEYIVQCRLFLSPE